MSQSRHDLFVESDLFDNSPCIVGSLASSATIQTRFLTNFNDCPSLEVKQNIICAFLKEKSMWKNHLVNSGI